MKKYFIISLFLVGCNEQTKSVKIHQTSVYDKLIIDSMTYLIFRNYSESSLFIVNKTKDSLEVTLLKKQLSDW